MSGGLAVNRLLDLNVAAEKAMEHERGDAGRQAGISSLKKAIEEALEDRPREAAGGRLAERVVKASIDFSDTKVSHQFPGNIFFT